MTMLEAFERWCGQNPLLRWRNSQERPISRSALTYHMTALGYKVTPATILRWERGENEVPNDAMNILMRITNMNDLRKRWARWQKQRLKSS